MKIKKEISNKVDRMILSRDKLKSNFEQVKKDCQHYNKIGCRLCMNIDCKNCSYFMKKGGEAYYDIFK